MEQKSIRACSTIIEIGIILLIIFSPLAFGSVEAWAYSIVILCAFALTIVWLIKLWLESGTKFDVFKTEPFNFKFSYLKTSINLPIILFIVLIIIQLVPLPGSIVHFLSPNTHEIYSESFNTLKVTSVGEELSGFSFLLSLCGYATKIELYKVISYALIFLLVLNNIKSGSQIRKFIYTIVIFAFCLSLYALIQNALWNGKIYWFRELRLGGNPFGPYVNRNHYAGFMEMTVPLALAAVAITRSINKKILFGFMALIMASTILISLSRGGMLAFFGSMVFIMIVFLFYKALKKPLPFIILLFIGIILFILYLQHFSIVADRLLTVIDPDVLTTQQRPLLWKDTLDIVKDFPLFGSGLGTFRYIFPKYKTFGDQRLYLYPENDYLQLAAETGIIGFAIVMWGLIAFIITSIKTASNNKTTFFLIGSIIAMIIHSFFDFNLHIPANAVMFSIILGLTLRFGYKDKVR